MPGEYYSYQDEQGNVLTEMAWVETDAAGYWARAKDHVYLDRDLIGTLDRATGEPQVVSYARDHLGSQRAEVWALDARTATDLWPYGALARTKAAGTAPSLADGAHLFTGHEREHIDTAPAPDPLQDLDYMHARYYSFEMGRFLSVDPVGGEVGSSQSWNRYAYVRGNPIGAIDPDGALEVRAFKVPDGYRYTITFDSKLERANRGALAVRSLPFKILGIRKQVGWGIKAGRQADKFFRGQPVRVFGEDTGVPAVSGVLDGPRFETMVKKEFFKRISHRPFYGERSREALRRAITAVVDQLVSKHKINHHDAVKILRIYDTRKIFEKAEEQASPSLSDWFVGFEPSVVDDGTAASTVVRCNGAYKFANQCK